MCEWWVEGRNSLGRGGGWCFPVKSNSTWSHRLCSSASLCGWNTLNSSYTSDIHFTPERQLIPYILRWKGNINQTFACAFFCGGGILLPVLAAASGGWGHLPDTRHAQIWFGNLRLVSCYRRINNAWTDKCLLPASIQLCFLFFFPLAN